MADCGSRTPLNRFFELSGHGGTSAKKEERAQINSRSRWLIVHLNELIDSDFELLNQWPDRISLVHCPRSHAHFRHRRFEFEKLSGCGLAICLGTDSLASNSGLSLFQEMRLFWKIHPEISPALILAMVTLNS